MSEFTIRAFSFGCCANCRAALVFLHMETGHDVKISIKTLRLNSHSEHRYSRYNTFIMKIRLGQPHFDVIVGNPPYQKNVSGSTDERKLRNASKSLPIYHEYVNFFEDTSAEIVIVSPARWIAGGWGLDEFRQKMLSSKRIRTLVLYARSYQVFPNTSINGGVSIIHVTGDEVSVPRIVNFDSNGVLVEDGHRRLLEPGADFLVRDPRSLSILQKIGCFQLRSDEQFSSMIHGAISGFNSNFTGFTETKKEPDDLKLVLIKWKEKWVSKEKSKDTETAGYRVLFQLSHGEGDPSAVSRARLYKPGVTYTHSHLGTIALPSEKAGRSVLSYVNSRFFRFLCFQLKITIVATPKVYRLIPIQAWDRIWTDDELYKKYGFTEDEIRHIENTVTAPRNVYDTTAEDFLLAWTD